MPSLPSENEESAAQSRAANTKGAGHPCACKIALFAVVALVWFVLDRATKAYAESFAVGTVFGGPFVGLVQFKLAHNTGAAWSLLSDSTLALGVFGAVMCLAITSAVVVFARHLGLLECLALGLIVAGGAGNAVDRFQLGYVVDFIQTLFISFPTFNVADIGVTCGVVLFACSYVVRTRKAEGR